ncbi:MAG: helix-turn-helix domain-containing protein [Thermoplasmatota archaeon]
MEGRMMDQKILKMKYNPPDILELGYIEIFEKIREITIFNPLMQTFERFILVCEVVWKEGPDIQFMNDLKIVEKAEEISREGKTSLVMVSGQFPEIYTEILRKFFETFNCFIEFPARLTREAMIGSIVGAQDNLNRFLAFAEAWGAEYEILSIQKYHPRMEAALSELTPKQFQCLEAAVRYGYFDIPKRIDARELASKLDISHATLLEHIKKGQRTILSTLFRE